MRIKVFTFNFKEFEPDKKGLYSYLDYKFTNRQFINFLKSRLIWFNTFYKEVENA